MRRTRACSRPACPRTAVSTLTYVHADSTAVLGPLVPQAEPHSYDLCAEHAESLTVPRGWQVVRLYEQTPREVVDYEDREGLARSVQMSVRARRQADLAGAAPATAPEAPLEARRHRRAHLRVLPGIDEAQ